MRRRTHGRRLAFIDSHPPSHQNSSRFAEALALREVRPDTVFFSTDEMDDPFPASVLPLREFPRLAPSLGITDVYGVSPAFMGEVLGLRSRSHQPPFPISGLDLSRVLERDGIRAHVSLYPGEDLIPDEQFFADLPSLVAAADNVFSWMPSVLDRVPGVTRIDPAVVDTSFYSRAERDFRRRPIELLLAVDGASEAGLSVALEAMSHLSSDDVCLHVVGSTESDHTRVGTDRTTFHGWLTPGQLRALHQRCDILLAPITDPAAVHALDEGVTTGGIPASAAEGMSSGLLLIVATPERVHRESRSDLDHIHVSATGAGIAAAVRRVLADPTGVATIADAGSQKVRERLDVRVGIASRLALMGFRPGRTSYEPPRQRRRPQAGARRPTVVRRSARSSGHAAPEPCGIDDLAAQLHSLRDSLTDFQAEQRRTSEEIRAMRRDLMALAQSAVDDESATWRALQSVRTAPEYETPFVERDPLVSVCIPTYTNYVGLIERAIPSALAQDHANIEVVVVGDAAPAETATAIRRLNDPRVRYENLPVRGPYPDDPDQRWLVAGTGPINHALQLADGAWIAINNDDDEMRPHHVSTLLAEARQSRVEVVYGRLLQHAPDGSAEMIGAFPPVHGGFGWQGALQHRAMRLFEFKLSAALFGEPGDWNRARRMLRAGVRFRMVDQVVCDYYPGRQWRTG